MFTSAVTLPSEGLSLVCSASLDDSQAYTHHYVVSVVANEGQRIDIPDGCILENRLVSGNLNLIVSLVLSVCKALV